MIIGLDAQMLAVKDDRLKVGVYRYVLGVLTELSKLDTTNQFRLYSGEPIDPDIVKQFSELWYPLVLRPMKAWQRLRLPLSLALHPVHMFLGFGQSLPRIVGPVSKIGVIYDLGFFDYPDAYPRSYRRLVRQTNQLINRQSAVITISESVKDAILRQYKLSPDRIHVASPGVEPIFTPQGDKKMFSYPYILHVGSLKPGKNIPLLLKIFAQYRRQYHSDIHIVLAGGSYWPDPRITEVIKEEDLADVVHDVGHVSDNELAEYYRGALALVVTSRTEGFCIPVIEAMASGLPVIAPRLPIFEEVVADTSLLCDTGKYQSYVDVLHQLITMPDLQRAISAKGIAKSSRYTYAAAAQVYKKVIEQYAVE